MTGRRDAVLQGTLEAARLLEELNAREQIEQQGGRIDVFAAICHLDVPLMFKALDGLLGAYLPSPSPGILVTTERQLAIQRYTAAHELGHHFMHHSRSLDGEQILNRLPFSNPAYDPNEVAADSFAAMFLMPDWLFAYHARRQNWDRDSLQVPANVYQMSLRVGTSYESTCRVLQRQNVLDDTSVQKLLEVQPKNIKQGLVGDRRLSSWRPNIWALTERDAGSVIYGEPEDLFVVQLKEHSGAGYLWDFEGVKTLGFHIVSDERVIRDGAQDNIGGAVERVLTAQSQSECRGKVEFVEARPWNPQDEIARMSFSYEFHKERGLSRAARECVSAA